MGSNASVFLLCLFHVMLPDRAFPLFPQRGAWPCCYKSLSFTKRECYWRSENRISLIFGLAPRSTLRSLKIVAHGTAGWSGCVRRRAPDLGNLRTYWMCTVAKARCSGPGERTEMEYRPNCSVHFLVTCILTVNYSTLDLLVCSNEGK